MSSNELQRLAKKFLSGTATKGEKELLNQWYDSVYTDDRLEIVSTEAAETEAEIKQRIFENIHKEITRQKQSEQQINKPGRIKIMAIRIATSAAILFIASCITWYFIRPVNTATNIQVQQLISITTKKITKIALADGSTVWLSAHTKFTYPYNFQGKIRQVELSEGRAFFDIKHQSNHPFIVKTKSLNITVLGTSFDVTTFQKEGTTKVSVITGKVGITRPGHINEAAVMLLPKQQIVLSKVTSVLTKEIVKEPVVNLWCKSPLVFEQQNLDSVFRAIEKQYNTHIQVENKKLLNERISITLSNQRLDTIMEILSFTKHFNYQIANDSTVVIK
jgi:transmembrane sensor